MKEAARSPGIAAQLPWIARRRVTGGRHDVSAFRLRWMKLLREVARFGTRIFLQRGVLEGEEVSGSDYLCWIKIFHVFFSF